MPLPEDQWEKRPSAPNILEGEGILYNSEKYTGATVKEISEPESRRRKRKKGMNTLRYITGLDEAEMGGSSVKLADLTKNSILLDTRYSDKKSGEYGPKSMEFSPGAFFSNRVALQSNRGEEQEVGSAYSVYVANDRVVNVVLDASRDSRRESENAAGILDHHIRHDASYTVGKGGVALPHSLSVVGHCVPIPGLEMRSEIQHICTSAPNSEGSSFLACTDSFGKVLYARLPGNVGDQRRDILDMVDISSIYTFSCDDGGKVVCEPGWTGAALSETESNLVAVARHFPRDITLFDTALPVRRFNSLYSPNDILLLSSNMKPNTGGSNIVAIAEGPCICVWDARIAGRGARIARLSSGPYGGQLYTLASASNSSCSLLGAAGEDRTVFVWDPRTWKTLSRWSSCLKYEITKLHFLSSNPSKCVASGLDYEVLCGTWFTKRGNPQVLSEQRMAKGRAAGPSTSLGSDAEAKRVSRVSASFRGTSRWIGLAKAPGRDDFVGITTDRALYYASFT